MKTYQKGFTLIELIVILAITLIMLSVVVLPFIEIPINTGSGKQVGFVSAIEKTGVIFKSGRAYIKPTLESTQEDIYCVMNNEVYKNLEVASRNKKRVEVSHYSVISFGPVKCAGEGVAITSVNEL